MKYAIFGDVAGHFRPFKRGLKSVGVDVKAFTIPDDLIVVQVGDLVHKGQNSALVVELVDSLMRANPGQWIQLAGNHELPYVMDHIFFYPDRVDLHTASILMKWRYDGLLLPSYALIDSSGQEYFVSHAGLTRNVHSKFGAGNAFDTSDAIQGADWNLLATKGTMMNGSYPNPEAGVFWAEGVSEVYASWLQDDGVPPFHQVHGHSSSYLWDRTRPRFKYREWFTDNWSKDFVNMHTTFTLGDKRFHAIDHGLDRKAFTDVILPLVIE